MKVLQIWNICGIPSVIAKNMDRLFGTKTFVMDRATFNAFDHETYGRVYTDSAKIFVLRCLIKASGYDVVHIHDLDQILTWMRRLYPRKPIVIHYHGSKVRGRWGSRNRFWSKADKILVSTEDLLEGAPEGTIYIHNPIDLDLIPHHDRKIPKAFFTSVKRGWANDLAEKFSSSRDLELVIHDRDNDPLPHKEYLEKLTRYEYFIDVRRDNNNENVLEALSMGALETLASGSKVIDWEGNIHEGLPPDHHPENVARIVYNIYKDLLSV